MVRDFARNLHSLTGTAFNDTGETIPLSIKQLDKQSWEVSSNNTQPLAQLVLDYHIYAYDLSVRSAYINDQYAFFNGTSVFLYVNGIQNIPHGVCIDQQSFLDHIPDASFVTAMPNYEPKQIDDVSNKLAYYRCDDYFELIDHPFLIGECTQHSFIVDEKTFHLVFTGKHDFDLVLMASDLTPIIAHHIALFGELPCDDYWFITLVCEGGFGGLEHLSSTVLQYSRFDLPLSGDNLKKDLIDSNEPQKRKLSKPYQQFLSLCSHELFHTWHVKRIKPIEMHQPDLSQEVYTQQLWIYEGFTSLYDDLSLARAGVIEPQEYVQILNEVFTRLLKNQGRHKQSVSASSFEAWSKFYKQDAGSVNHIVSYYNKGAVLALCLDITIRQQSNDQYCLDDLMRILWLENGKTNIGTANDVVEKICAAHFNLDLNNVVQVLTQSTIDLPFQTLLHSIGLDMQIRNSQNVADKGGAQHGNTQHIDIGANYSVSNHQISVLAVYDGRAASLAGLMVGDIIIAVEQLQCDESRLLRLLNNAKLGGTVSMHVFRDGRLLELSFPVIKAEQDTCEITITDKQRFEEWLGLPAS